MNTNRLSQGQEAVSAVAAEDLSGRGRFSENGREWRDAEELDARLALTESVRAFCELTPEEGETDEALHHRVMARIHATCVSIVACEVAGLSRDEIVSLVAPARAIHARSPFVRRLQEWPRGYPGDFETVEYICHARNQAEPGTIEAACESYSLNLPIAQQHRNKVRHQAARVLETMMAKPKASRILTLACGSCPDFRQLGPLLDHFAGEIFLNDSDEAALEFVAPTFARIADRVRYVPGNALKIARRMEREPKFDLVLAGGLFDYLPDRHATYLIETIYHGLIAEGGTFYFTNIARGNPYRSLIEHLGDWILIERSDDDIRALCTDARVPETAIQMRRDETGLALLVEVGR